MIQKYWNSNRIKNFGNVKQHEEKILEKGGLKEIFVEF
ncbi:hypothetical protein T01_5791 [Trichinella spiralis]|uniref:Uncharacterized protein n=1 Tax=Trichinella spiralis TaxID=6334 RepID=A0A0V1AMJ0_TRISP|nr:hypothetical protein T01_5791 [Trichinella spiralis]